MNNDLGLASGRLLPGRSLVDLDFLRKGRVFMFSLLKGRSVARSLGLMIGGLLGELLHARLNGHVPSLATEIKRLREEAGFFVGSDIERFILSQAGE